jgi:hypothetical protein
MLLIYLTAYLHCTYLHCTFILYNFTLLRVGRRRTSVCLIPREVWDIGKTERGKVFARVARKHLYVVTVVHVHLSILELRVAAVHVVPGQPTVHNLAHAP